MKKLDQSNIWKYILYTICFWGFIGPLIYKISKMGLATIGTSDAISQIYPIMMYTRGLLKELLGGDVIYGIVVCFVRES